MKRPPAALACAALAALAGCGGGDRPPEEVVREYVEAFDRADEGRACGELVTDAYLTAVSGGKAGEAARDACRRQLEALEPLSIRIELVPEIEQRGDSAEVTIRLQVDGDPQRQRIRLRRRDGEWLVDRVTRL